MTTFLEVIDILAFCVLICVGGVALSLITAALMVYPITLVPLLISAAVSWHVGRAVRKGMPNDA